MKIFLCTVLLASLQSAWGCDGDCRLQKEQRRLEQVKATLLHGLGLKEVPRVSHANMSDIPAHMMQEIKNRYSDKVADEPVEKTFVFSTGKPHGGQERTAFFNFPENLPSKRLVTSHLHVFIRKAAGEALFDYGDSVEVVVYERLLDGTLNPTPVGAKRVAAKPVGRYVDVPLEAEDVERWFTDEVFAGLFVLANFEGENLALHPQDGMTHENMYLEMETVPAVARTKRSRSVCQLGEEGKQPGCCLYDYVVNFKKDLGWDFVIAPEVFNAYMCKGDCTHNGHLLRDSNHAYLAVGGKAIDRHGLIGDGKSSCCYPSEFEEAAIIYMDNKNTVSIREIPGMIARKCACA